MEMASTYTDARAAGVPFLVSWNVTKRCNLKCAHCYLDATELAGGAEATTTEARRTIDEIAGLAPGAMLIMTGGEPMLRPDMNELASYASEKGLTVVLGTNGTLLDDDTVAALKKSGVKGFGISLDSAAPAFHDRFRGVTGAWERTLAGIDALKKKGMDFQLQLTVTRENRKDLRALMDFAVANGVRAVNVFFLVCTGRGQGMTDITPAEYEETLKELASEQARLEGTLMVRARCAPHFLRITAGMNPDSSVMRGHTSGCIAGTGYLRISPEGQVTPCPYIPASSASANVRTAGLRDIWENDRSFVSLRKPEYKGRCKDCEFDEVCGGCRARAYAASGDLMGEDPWCGYEPKGKAAAAKKTDPVWSEEAKGRLGRIPVFLRPMIKKGVERYASSKGIIEITPDLMDELRKKSGR